VLPDSADRWKSVSPAF